MLNPQALQLLQQYLAQFAARDDFETTIATIFGTDRGAAALRQQWLNGDFSLIPEIEVLSTEDIGGANGVYAASLDKIFVASSFFL
jgi:hypothetical protein